ncbi:MAG: hypothetical protein AAFR16_12595 [Pseudomonadota bacterium]
MEEVRVQSGAQSAGSEATPQMEAAMLAARALQYETYVREAEALIGRRAEVNRFYVSLNTALIGGFGYLIVSNSSFLHEQESGEAARLFEHIFATAPVFGLVICYLWYAILQSQRGIIRSKFDVVHDLEGRLPERPYAAEAEGWRSNTAPRSNAMTPGRFELLLPFVYAIGYISIATAAFEIPNSVMQAIEKGREAASQPSRTGTTPE